MSQTKYIAPEFNLSGFHCPLCHVYAKQEWRSLFINGNGTLKDTYIAECDHCHDFSIWYNKKMIYPDNIILPPPNSDLLQDIQEDYLEAASIMSKSPRGAAALLRLGIQKVCKQLGEKGENTNDDIASLVKKGLSPTIQQSLDIVRVVGNNAVHPGQIDLKDNTEIAAKLFDLINIIADMMISKPKQIQQLYDSLPKKDTDNIAKRDGRLAQ